jgi:hypothetical protein
MMRMDGQPEVFFDKLYPSPAVALDNKIHVGLPQQAPAASPSVPQHAQAATTSAASHELLPGLSCRALDSCMHGLASFGTSTSMDRRTSRVAEQLSLQAVPSYAGLEPWHRRLLMMRWPLSPCMQLPSHGFACMHACTLDTRMLRYFVHIEIVRQMPQRCWLTCCPLQ